MKATKATLIESGSLTGSYELVCRDAIVDDPRHGRLYVTEAYGGEQSLRGGAYRWGLILPVPESTTLAEARKIDPRDPASPNALEWSNSHVDRYMQSLGL